MSDVAQHKLGSLSLDHLRVLVTIADVGSFTAAGKKLYRAQSAISQAIATLEEMQGVALFDRSGHRPVLTETGHVLVEQARLVLASAARFEAVAAHSRGGIEPELNVAIDPLVPTGAFIETLRDFGDRYPSLPVAFATEGLGGALRGLRSGTATVAICVLLPQVPDDVVAFPLLQVAMRPYAAPSHPLASLGRPATPGDLEPHVQLVLSDPVEGDSGHYGLASARRWRFVDLGRRLDFLVAGFGWCRMPEHVVADACASGSLKSFEIADDPTPAGGLTIYAAHRRDDLPGPAGRWLLDDLRRRMTPDGSGEPTA